MINIIIIILIIYNHIPNGSDDVTEGVIVTLLCGDISRSCKETPCIEAPFTESPVTEPPFPEAPFPKAPFTESP